MDQLPEPRISLRRNLFFAVIGRGVYVVTQFATLAVLARLGSPADVGVFTLASAIVTPLFFLTSLGMRDVHTVDDLTRYSRADYVALRLAGGCLALALSMGAVLVLHGPAQVAVVTAVAGFAMVKFFGAQTSLNHGVFQRAERLDFVALSNLARGGGGVVVFALIFAATKDLTLALFAEAAMWFASYYFVDQPMLRRVGAVTGWGELGSVRMRSLLALFWWLLPVGLVLWLLRAAMSAPPIVLARHADLETVGVFGAIAYVYSALAMVTNTMGSASAARLRRLYRKGARSEFLHLILRLAAGSALAAGLAIGLGALLGETVLGLVFGDAYRRGDLLMILLLASAVGIASGPFVTGLQAGQAFRRRLLTGIAGFAAAWTSALVLVPLWGAAGAAWSMVAMALANAAVTLWLFAGLLRAMPGPAARGE